MGSNVAAQETLNALVEVSRDADEAERKIRCISSRKIGEKDVIALSKEIRSQTEPLQTELKRLEAETQHVQQQLAAQMERKRRLQAICPHPKEYAWMDTEGGMSIGGCKLCEHDWHSDLRTSSLYR